MHSVTDRQTDGRQDYANSCVAVRSAKIIIFIDLCDSELQCVSGVL